MKRLVFIVSVLVLISALILGGCTETTPTTSAPTTPAPTTPAPTTPAPTTPAPTTPAGPQYGGILTIILANLPATPGYPPNNYPVDHTYYQCPYEALVDHTNTGEFRPWLATDVILAPDKLSITFPLRQGVKFHDGTDFNAEAAKWNLEEYKAAGTLPLTAAWDSIDVVDDYTVRININKFTNVQLGSYLDSLYMMSPTAVEENGRDWAHTHPVGTGPFKFKKFVRDISLEFERFDDWWAGKPYLDGVKYVYNTDPAAIQMAFEAGEAQVIETGPVKPCRDLVDKGFKLLTRYGALQCLTPDSANDDSPFADLRVRQAVEYAINKPQIEKALLYGFWEAAEQVALPKDYGYIPDYPVRSYDPDKARALLAEAGYPDGFSTKITLPAPLMNDAMLAVQSYLNEVGIKTEMDATTDGPFFQMWTQGWHDQMCFSFAGGSDYNYCRSLEQAAAPWSVHNASMLKPDELTGYIEQALASAEVEDMVTYCQKAAKYVMDNALWIPLWVMVEPYVMYPFVHDAGYGTHGRPHGWDPGLTWLSSD